MSDDRKREAERAVDDLLAFATGCERFTPYPDGNADHARAHVLALFEAETARADEAEREREAANGLLRKVVGDDEPGAYGELWVGHLLWQRILDHLAADDRDAGEGEEP